MTKFSLASILKPLAEGHDISADQAESMMRSFILGDFSPVELGCIMMGMRLKGETPEELEGMVRAYRAASITVATSPDLDVVDVCGTGGDGPSAGVFNISTTSMFVAAGAGVPMTKHGTSAVSSQSGSSDVLEALGGRNLRNPRQVSECLDAIGLAFMHGPSFNQGMKNVIQSRREAGIRSFFNLLGPMSNPANPRRQVIGIYDRRYTNVVAETLGRLGAVHVMAVSAHNGLDEISTEGLTQISEFKNGKVTTMQFDPAPFGFSKIDWDELHGGDPAFNASKMIRILNGQISGCAREIVALNAAAAIIVGGLASSFEEGLAMADQSIDSGRALEKLDDYRRWTSREDQVVANIMPPEEDGREAAMV
ncbi:anthranilate phosphoribosyltransferase (plasmid) [Rhizobium sp. CB3171]|uniref:anthranilate phosphoribosyltransferase n=1 Tax=Rhizobium sp. CB3171 TaxID=3039157 RepID=UPI0024B048FC|nr:anthranilate phosphoribosyltransferase [Rhizobium sp. CB3171]WFU05752.1 anthranilate phosphoribosyltransferase [Rhizobium sp. CB3171]